jgi:serine/threonine-protein kinase SRK2
LNTYGTTGEMVAIKFIPLGERFYQKYVEREILNHRHLVHPHIVAFKEVFVTPSYLAIVMEFVGGGNLQSWVEKYNRLAEWQARCFFQQLILALHYSHKSAGIAHRDIKLGNILLNDKYQVPILKLCDFGYSKDSWQGSLPKTRVGTAAYISPEVASANVSTVQYDSEKADVWSSAVTLYCMVSGRYPFTDHGNVPQLYQIKNLRDTDVSAALDVLPDVSAECKTLLQQCLQVDPKKRIGLDGIIENTWFRQYLPDISKMVSTPVKHMQTEDEILLVLAQAEERSKQIVLLQSRTEFDDEAAMEVADEVLREIDGPTARPTSLVEDTIDHTR